MKKQRIAKLLVIILIMLSVFSPLRSGSVMAEESEDTYEFSTSPGIYKPVQVDEFYFNNISLRKANGMCNLYMDVINMGEEVFQGNSFQISIISKGEEMIELLGYIGGDFQPGEIRTISSGTDMDLMDAKLMVISVNGREKNTFLKNTNTKVVGSRVLDDSIYIHNIDVYGLNQWVFECDIRGVGKRYWNYEMHFKFKDVNGNTITEFLESLPKNFSSGDSSKAVLETDIDLSQADSLEVELRQKYSPRIVRTDMEIIHKTAEGSQISIDNVYAIREENTESWDVFIAFLNNGTEKKRVYIDEVWIRDENDGYITNSGNEGELEVEAGKTATYRMLVGEDIEQMHSIEITTEVSEGESVLPTATPSVSEAPKPTDSPFVTATPKVTATPFVTEQPKVTETPIATNEPENTESPQTTLQPILPDVPKSVDTQNASVDVQVKGIKGKIKGNSIQISWKSVKGISEYQIYRSTKKNSGYKRIQNVIGKTKYVDRNIKKGKTYYYKVRIKENGTFSKAIRVQKPYYICPGIQVKNKSYSAKLNYVEIKLKKYEGKFLELYYKKGNGKFARVSLRSNRLKKGKNVFRISYQKNIKKLYFKVRTYGKIKGKKKYSDFSKTIMIKNGK